MKLKSRHFENYPISGNQKPLRAFFTHIWGYFVQCDYTLLRMTDHYPVCLDGLNCKVFYSVWKE